MGDGQTTFNNFIYYTLAGFSEFDNFRSNQVCEELISRDDAINLAKKDNEFKYDILKNHHFQLNGSRHLLNVDH